MLPHISHRDLMRPITGSEPFSEPDWVFELKWDGVRCLLTRRGRDVRMLTRAGNDLASAFPEILLAAGKVSPDFVIDGELVVLNHRGHPDFHQLQRRAVSASLRSVLKGAIARPATLMAFDLLAVGDRDVRSLPLVERKTRLCDLLPPDRGLQYVDHIEANGADMFCAVQQLGLEGVVGKRADSSYQRGRSRDWVQFKTPLTREREGTRFSHAQDI